VLTAPRRGNEVKKPQKKQQDLLFIKDGIRLPIFIALTPSTSSAAHGHLANLPPALTERIQASAANTATLRFLPLQLLVPASWARRASWAREIGEGVDLPRRAIVCPALRDPETPEAVTQTALRLAHEMFVAVAAAGGLVQGGGFGGAAAAAAAQAASAATGRDVLTAMAASALVVYGTPASSRAAVEDLADRLARVLYATAGRSMAALLRVLVFGSEGDGGGGGGAAAGAAAQLLSACERRALRKLLADEE
jgi:hypothetical protein